MRRADPVAVAVARVAADRWVVVPLAPVEFAVATAAPAEAAAASEQRPQDLSALAEDRASTEAEIATDAATADAATASRPAGVAAAARVAATADSTARVGAATAAFGPRADVDLGTTAVAVAAPTLTGHRATAAADGVAALRFATAAGLDGAAEVGAADAGAAPAAADTQHAASGEPDRDRGKEQSATESRGHHVRIPPSRKPAILRRRSTRLPRGVSAPCRI